MTTDPDTIDQAAEVIRARNERMAADAKVYADLEDARAERDEMAAENQRLKAGNEALRQDIPDGDLVELKAEWKACAEQLAAERDKAIAERNMAVGKVDEMRQRLAIVMAEQHATEQDD